jgi:hypothetical protein
MKDKLLAILENYAVRFRLTEGEQADGIDSENFSDIINDITELQKNLLYEFWQRSSDACPLEATEAEKQEKDFYEWVSSL